MNIAIMCEFSGRVREAFRERGHNAWSIDLEPSEIPGQHIQGDCLEYLKGLPQCPTCGNFKYFPLVYPKCDNEIGCWVCQEYYRKKDWKIVGWDMIIAFPPCTDLSAAGARYWKEKEADGRQQAAIDFFMALWNAPTESICIENPVGKMNPILKPSQIIHPYYFGEPFQKRTCLWIRGLPLLQSTDILPKPAPLYHISKGKKCEGKPVQWCHAMSGGKDQAKNRSRTFPGIARAMAEQWG